jgi:uncharacterized protein YkwD
MKAYKLPLLLVLVACLFVSCSKDNLDNELENYANDLIIPASKTIEIEILELINNHRINEGLSALSPLDLIKSQTYSHNDYMIDQNEVSHDNFFVRRNFLMNNAGANRVSENVAYGYSSAEAVVNAWLNSEGHRENIEGDHTHFEVSADLDENGHWYYTNIFVKK